MVNETLSKGSGTRIGVPHLAVELTPAYNFQLLFIDSTSYADNGRSHGNISPTGKSLILVNPWHNLNEGSPGSASPGCATLSLTQYGTRVYCVLPAVQQLVPANL